MLGNLFGVVCLYVDAGDELKGVFTYLTHKPSPKARIALRHRPILGRFNNRWRKREEDSLS